MEINIQFLNTILPALKNLREKIGSYFVVFGSAPLYLLGILSADDSFNDLDIAVRDISVVPPEAKTVTFQGNPEQKFYKLDINGISIDIGSAWPGQEVIFESIFSDPIEAGGFKFASLRAVEDWKGMMVEKYGREKDRRHLEKIREYRKSNLKCLFQ